MAHILANGDLAEVTPVCSYLGQYTMNVLMIEFLNVVGGTVTDDDAADEFDATLGPLYRAILPAAASYYGLRLQVVQNTRYDPQFDNDSAGAGSLAGDPLPAQVAGVVALKTGFAARARQGRMYLPASGEALNDGTAKPSAAWITAASSIANALIGGGTIIVGAGSVDWRWVVYSRNLNLRTPITGFQVRANWGTRRSRSLIGQGDVAPF